MYIDVVALIYSTCCVVGAAVFQMCIIISKCGMKGEIAVLFNLPIQSALCVTCNSPPP